MDSKKSIRNGRPLARNPKVVGTPRTEFGTRLCQRVTCNKCRKVDYVPVRVGRNKEALCRDCAERVLQTFDVGRHIQEKTIDCTCDQCHRSFALAESVYRKVEDLLCLDCLRGFDVWRGKAAITKTSSVKQRPILTKIGSHLTLRKIIDDTI